MQSNVFTNRGVVNFKYLYTHLFIVFPLTDLFLFPWRYSTAKVLMSICKCNNESLEFYHYIIHFLTLSKGKDSKISPSAPSTSNEKKSTCEILIAARSVKSG